MQDKSSAENELSIHNSINSEFDQISNKSLAGDQNDSLVLKSDDKEYGLKGNDLLTDTDSLKSDEIHVEEMAKNEEVDIDTVAEASKAKKKISVAKLRFAC